MVAKIAGSMIVCVAVLIVVSLGVSFHALWLTGNVIMSAAIGTIGGLAAAFAVDALHNGLERAGGRLSDENYGFSSDRIANRGRPMKPQGADPKGSQK